MLADQVRMNAFREAIAVAVPQGSRCWSWAAAPGAVIFCGATGGEVWCVERNPELVQAARASWH